jgi:hypothetical protein
MRAIFAGRDRKIIPVLLGFVLLNVCALVQDLPTGNFSANSASTQRTLRSKAFNRGVREEPAEDAKNLSQPIFSPVYHCRKQVPPIMQLSVRSIRDA